MDGSISILHTYKASSKEMRSHFENFPMTTVSKWPLPPACFGDFCVGIPTQCHLLLLLSHQNEVLWLIVFVRFLIIIIIIIIIIIFLLFFLSARFLGHLWCDLFQTSHMNRASLKRVHSTFEIFKMAAISKWPPFVTFTILHDFSELDGSISIILHTSIEHHSKRCIQLLKIST